MRLGHLHVIYLVFVLCFFKCICTILNGIFHLAAYTISVCEKRKKCTLNTCGLRRIDIRNCEAKWCVCWTVFHMDIA